MIYKLLLSIFYSLQISLKLQFSYQYCSQSFQNRYQNGHKGIMRMTSYNMVARVTRHWKECQKVLGDGLHCQSEHLLVIIHVHVHVQVKCSVYRLARNYGIPRLRNAFYRLRKSTERAEHIYTLINTSTYMSHSCSDNINIII